MSTTINKEEIQKFSKLADEWWDVNGKFKPLHMFNPVRIEYILDNIKKHFNLKKNTTGAQIDKEARKFLKKIGLDYAHGTGHGVGYFLNVHEGPQSISKNNKTSLYEGMVISNEPGYYEKNNFGIRIENLIYVKKKKNKKVFENLTMAPIEKELIDISLLSTKEKNWINSYHQTVFKNLRNRMYKNDLIELKKACSAI